jgi:arylsulfatase A-like enzyme
MPIALRGAAETPPNLLLIMTDQQRFSALSCAGNATLQTPTSTAWRGKGRCSRPL